MASAIVLIGVPGSGKSTLARGLVQRSPTTVIISPDRLRQQLYGDVNIQGDWAILWTRIESAFAQASANGVSVIYDATNCQALHRKEIINLARNCGFAPINGWWLDEPLWVCLMRNQYRDRQVPEEKIIQMYREVQISPPNLREGFDAILCPQDKNESEWMD